MYKNMRAIDRVNGQCIFTTIGQSRTGVHRFKVRRERVNRNLRGTFFTESLFTELKCSAKC